MSSPFPTAVLMPRKSRTITSLPWTHFLRRLYWFKLPHENDPGFIARAGITKHNKSKWFKSAHPTPSIDTIDKIATYLKLTPEEQYWLTFGSKPPLPTPPSLSVWRAPSPAQLARELVEQAAKLYGKREHLSEDTFTEMLVEAFTLSINHAGLVWSATEERFGPGAPYASPAAAAEWLRAEVRALWRDPDFASRLDLLGWVSGALEMIARPMTKRDLQTPEGSPKIIPFKGRLSVTSREPMDTASYFYIPKAEPRLAAGAGTLVISERSDDYYAFRLDWLNQVASNKGDLWLFEVTGDSMSPTLEHADVVLIDCGRKEPLHDKIYAIEEDNAVSIKRLQERTRGAFWIVSDNLTQQAGERPIYPPRKLIQGVRIIGRMIWSARTWV